MNTNYECVIGLEIHVELKTNTKIFCGCKTDFGKQPNTCCCEVCMGFPGALPVLNEKVVHHAIKASSALNCTINRISSFDRKNYFYPDLPKGYQITQYFHPIAENGYLNIDTQDGQKQIRIERIHIEEDAGKLIHEENITKVDFNRCGIPLIEIVTKPDMQSADEAVQFLKNLRLTLLYLGISDCKMNEGSLRCDINISVRKKGTTEFSKKVEIKNINSFQFAHKAIEFEFLRQTSVLEKGKKIEQETRRFDEKTNTTISMRKKENSHDYRYFPEPDLQSITLTDEIIDNILSDNPLLPGDREKLYIENYNLSKFDANTLISEPEFAYIFDKTSESASSKKSLANLIISECFRLKKEKGTYPLKPILLSDISNMQENNQIGSSNAKRVLAALWDSSLDAYLYAKENNLLQINDKDIIKNIAKEVIEENQKSVLDYKSGKQASFKALMGKLMSKTDGRANPKIASEILEQILR